MCGYNFARCRKFKRQKYSENILIGQSVNACRTNYNPLLAQKVSFSARNMTHFAKICVMSFQRRNSWIASHFFLLYFLLYCTACTPFTMFTVFTVFTLFILFTLLGLLRFWAECGVDGWVGDWMGDTPSTVMTTRAPAVLIRKLLVQDLSLVEEFSWKKGL